jgi:hypothetical protein
LIFLKNGTTTFFLTATDREAVCPVVTVHAGIAVKPNFS